MTIPHTEEFDKEIKSLCKKYRHIEEDVETFEQALETNQYGTGLIVGATRISNLGEKIKQFPYKAEKFNSTDFHATNKFRVIYAYFPVTKKFLLLRIYTKAGYEKSEEELNRQIIYKYCC